MCSTPPIRVIHSSPAQRDKSLTSLVLIQYFKVMRFLLEEGKKKKKEKDRCGKNDFLYPGLRRRFTQPTVIMKKHSELNLNVYTY